VHLKRCREREKLASRCVPCRSRDAWLMAAKRLMVRDTSWASVSWMWLCSIREKKLPSFFLAAAADGSYEATSRPPNSDRAFCANAEAAM
jgi:hypothetical protein